MSKLQKYASTSELMDIHITLSDGEKFKFNLFTELEISEDRITFEAKEQSSSYAFLATLKNRLAKAEDDRKLEREKAWASAYLRAKQSTNPETGRAYADEMAKATAETSKEYTEAYKRWSEAKYKAQTLESAVKAFEMRGSLIQTISANNRKEK